MDDSVQEVVAWHTLVMSTGLLCYSYEGLFCRQRKDGHSRRSPFLTSLLRPIPSARRSIMAPLADPHGQEFHNGSIVPPCVRVHRLGLLVIALASLPHAAQTPYSSEASRTRTFERNTWRFSIGRRAGASVGAVASYSIKYAGCDLSSRVA